MVADSGRATRWLLWIDAVRLDRAHAPVHRQRPLAARCPRVACRARARRRRGRARRRAATSATGVSPSRDVARLRPFGLGSPFGLAVRLERPVLVAWCVGAVAAGLAFGVIAKVDDRRRCPTSLSDTLDKFGVQRQLRAAVLRRRVPARRHGRRAAAGRPDRRGRRGGDVGPARARARRAGAPVAWFAGRLALAAGAVVVAGLLAGLGAWLGAQSQGVDLGFGRRWSAPASTSCRPRSSRSGIGARRARRRAACGGRRGVRGRRSGRSSSTCSARWSSGLSWLDAPVAVPLHGARARPGPRPDDDRVTTAVGVALCGVALVTFSRRDLARVCTNWR